MKYAYIAQSMKHKPFHEVFCIYFTLCFFFIYYLLLHECCGGSSSTISCLASRSSSLSSYMSEVLILNMRFLKVMQFNATLAGIVEQPGTRKTTKMPSTFHVCVGVKMRSMESVSKESLSSVCGLFFLVKS